MSVQRILLTLRLAVRERAQGCCEYCRVHEEDILLPHEPDHVIAEQHRGQSTLENLALACFHGNRFKGPNIASVDPQTARIVQLFNPREDRWLEHFQLDGPRIIPITAHGRATVLLLRLNSPQRLRVRESLIGVGRFPIYQP